MAHITPGTLVTDIRGKLGSIVFVRTQAGLIARNAPCRPSPDSHSKFTARARTAEVAAAWTALSEAQRAAWTAAALTVNRSPPIGANTKHTARALFFRVNLSRAYPPGTICTALDDTLVTTAPQQISLSATLDIGIGWGFKQRTPVTADIALLWGARPITTSPRAHFRRWAFIAAAPMPNPGVSMLITPQFVAALGQPTLGEQIAIKMVAHLDNHLPAQTLFASATVTQS